MLTFKEAKANFFDRQVVVDAVDEGSRKVLSQLGAFTKTVAQRSIKQARRLKLEEMSPEMQAQYQGTKVSQRPYKSSEPGEPPRSRTRKLKKGILYAFDPSTKSAVAGAMKFSPSSAPEVLEHGGSSEVEIVVAPKRKGRTATEKQREGLAKARAAGKLKRGTGKANRIRKAVQIAARPYMAPALEAVQAEDPRQIQEPHPPINKESLPCPQNLVSIAYCTETPARYGTPVWNDVPNVKDLTLSMEKSEADVTTRASGGWRWTIGTLKDGTIEFQMVADTTDDDFTAIQTAFFDNTSIEFAVMDGPIATSGSEGLRATMDVLKF